MVPGLTLCPAVVDSGVHGGAVSGVHGGAVSGVQGGAVSGVQGGTDSGVHSGAVSTRTVGTVLQNHHDVPVPNTRVPNHHVHDAHGCVHCVTHGVTRALVGSLGFFWLQWRHE